MSNLICYSLFDDGAAAQAAGRILELFGMSRVEFSKGGTNLDLLVMVGAASGVVREPSWLSETMSAADDVSLLFLEIPVTGLRHHPYSFLTEIMPTYRLPLSDFSIQELARIVLALKKGGENYLVELPLVDNRLEIIEKMREENQVTDFQELSDYLCEPGGFIERMMHEAGGGENRDILGKETVKSKIVTLDYWISLLRVSRKLSINVLVVENNPEEIRRELAELKSYFTGINFFLIRKEFERFRNALHSGTEIRLSEYIEQDEGAPFCNSARLPDFSEIDLILQDIYLGENGISGVDLVFAYCNVAPQAILFYLTSMDVETLAASGYADKVDRIISKDRIQALMKYYYERFQELYGPLLWSVFLDSRERGVSPSLIDKVSVRHLLANIRLWTMEPGILFHGYALPEMVDHEMRHTVGLWNMTNRILGPYLERRSKNVIGYGERMLLALAIWLHDIGHRGDEYHSESMDIREHHGSISESIILAHPEALGIDWLLELCPDENCQEKNSVGEQSRLAKRNRKSGCTNNDGQLCPLRLVGLLCRYHQSNAPLTVKHLVNQLFAMKFPSPYCIIAVDHEGKEREESSQEQVEQWLDYERELDWFASDIRVLADFETGRSFSLYNLIGMLSWLDAIHTHSEKVGTQIQVRSFMAYNKMRKKFCNRRLRIITERLDHSSAGSDVYLRLLAEQDRLNRYEELLDHQAIHLWRSGMVDDIYGEWYWDGIFKKWQFRIIFHLKAADPLEPLKELFSGGLSYQDFLEGDDLWDKWSRHVFAEVIEKEQRRQELDSTPGGTKHGFLHYFENSHPVYCYTVDGKNKYKMGLGK